VPVVDAATTATATGDNTKTLADEVKGDVAWMAMMAITDKFFTNLRACSPKKPHVRKLLDEYTEAMSEHALAFCEHISSTQQAALIEKCEMLCEHLRASQQKENTKEKFKCECVECGHKMESETHCKDLKCPKCGGTMRREERPGPGQKTEETPAGTPPPEPQAPAEEPAPPAPAADTATETPPEQPKAITIDAFRTQRAAPPTLTIGDVKRALEGAFAARNESLKHQLRTKVLGRLD
jgi:predicted RNA-binding Zn-ribbon protein involved in translation (DUF1610 family)